eukprot:GFUD01008571.1.p1 GENE.GFUD01008571.1~~GFUD01008571.1.p1  ORF type:complete len:438 (-),score=120.28 GFUD01008571.1:45-1358(-)
MSTLSVAVIGAGAAGLCAARHLSVHPLVRTTVFEQSSTIGGTWVYTDNIGRDQHGLPVHSSMYKNLRTNLPKEVMAFPDFPFPETKETSFIHHSEVLDYLESYKKHFEVEKLIKFHTQVSRVNPVLTEDQTRWEVTTKCLKTEEVATNLFDSVMVCNGHYSVPVIPKIPGIAQFSGSLIHSHDYRVPEAYQGDSVIILGGGASGTDICIELSQHAAQVYLAHNNPLLTTKLPPNVAQIRGVESCIGPAAFLLTDGSKVQCSAIILATGYEYNFPFLSEDCQVRLENRQVQTLYKHLVSVDHPTLCFVGIPVQICPFPQFDLQIRYFVKLLTGQAKLPTKAEMCEETRREMEWKMNNCNMPEKYFHKMGALQWDYNREIAQLGNLKPIPMGVENLYNAVHERRKTNLPDYKKDSYSLVGEEGFSGNIFIPEKGTYKKV